MGQQQMTVKEERIAQTVLLCEKELDKQIIPSNMWIQTYRILLQYLSPVFWFMQALALVMSTIALTDIGSIELCPYIGVMISIVSLPDLYRDLFNKTCEIEFTCKYSPAKMVGSKTILIYALNNIAICLSTVILMTGLRCSFLVAFFSISFAYNISVVLILILVHFIKARDRKWIVLSCIIGASTANLVCERFLSELLASGMLYLLALISYGVVFYSFCKFIKERKEVALVWN